MDSHDELLIKLKDSKPKVTLITQPFYYHLLSSPTSRACISTTKRDPSVVNYCGFTCICEQSFVELKNFYQFVSLASLVLKKKYNRYSKYRTILSAAKWSVNWSARIFLTHDPTTTPRGWTSR